MSWLKDIYLDIIVLVLVLVYSFYQIQVLEVIFWIYSGLLLLVKILAFFMPSLGKRASKTSAPDYIFHIIYLIIVVAFFYTENIYLAIIWIIIWAASFYQSLANKK